MEASTLVSLKVEVEDVFKCTLLLPAGIGVADIDLNLLLALYAQAVEPWIDANNNNNLRYGTIIEKTKFIKAFAIASGYQDPHPPHENPNVSAADIEALEVISLDNVRRRADHARSSRYFGITRASMRDPEWLTRTQPVQQSNREVLADNNVRKR